MGVTAPNEAADARRRLSEALGDLRRITSSPRLDRRVAVRSGVPIGFAAFAVLNKVDFGKNRYYYSRYYGHQYKNYYAESPAA